MKRAVWLALLVLAGCSKKDTPKTEPVASASASAVVAPSASGSSGSGGGKGRKHEDRHEQAAPAALKLDVTIAGEKKTWAKDSFDKTAKFSAGATANDGENRDTWSLRDLAHTLVGPNARVTAVLGDETYPIDQAAWSNADKTPIVHTTRRGTFKFRWADKAGKWGEAEVNDVSGLEIAK